MGAMYSVKGTRREDKLLSVAKTSELFRVQGMLVVWTRLVTAFVMRNIILIYFEVSIENSCSVEFRCKKDKSKITVF